jgi:hypothetical protein
MRHGPPLACVVGEFWERALVARAQVALALEGIDALTYQFRYDHDTRPLCYHDILGRLVRTAATDRHLLIVPASVIVQGGFCKALEELIDRTDLEHSARKMIDPRQRQLALCTRSRQLDRSTACWSVEDDLAKYVRRVEIDLRAQPLPISYRPGQPLRRLEGRQTFQALRELDGEPQRLETNIQLLDLAMREALPGGWVYRCNNEPVEVSIDRAFGSDTLVALGSGIKAWYLANELRRSLRSVVIIDASLPQLRFAGDVFRSLATAESWDQLCELSAYTATDDSQWRESHNRLLRRIAPVRNDWRFDVTFVHCNLVTQTFRFIRLLKALSTSRPVLWYSNVFQPYLRAGCSEHHVGLEESFVRLLSDEFPSIVLFNSSVLPQALI